MVLVHVVDDEWGLLGPGYAREAERHKTGSLNGRVLGSRGSVTHDVLMNINVPVLIARSD